MTAKAPRVYSIAPSGRFLNDLASEILCGFPFGSEKKITPPLGQWTILLPTRRAARVLGSLLMARCGKAAMLLPTIRPIGDIDDDRLTFINPSSSVPDPISRTGHVFMLLDILKLWATQHPHISLAQEIQDSELQRMALAKSLLQLVDQVETEETNFNHLSEAYNSDLSEHRHSILSLLGTLKIELPLRLNREGLLGPAARRSMLLKLEAERISQTNLKGPIIAAGSTGTIPATRMLLKAIAHHAQGSVVLPGLDLAMEDDEWNAIGADHPQFAMKNLITAIEVARGDITELGTANTNRNIVSAELMRPSHSAENWHKILPAKKPEMQLALQDLKLIEAPDRHVEARAIALKLREALETPNQTAALVTPDRDLAQRVKSELLRWNISIDDSAGEQLCHHGMASLAALFLQAACNGFKSADLLSLLSHPSLTWGMEQENLKQLCQHLEIALLRGYGSDQGVAGLHLSLKRVVEAKKQKSRMHVLAERLSDDNWQALSEFITHLITCLQPFANEDSESAKQHLCNFKNLLAILAPQADLQHPANIAFEIFLTELEAESHRLEDGNFANLAQIILPLLREQKLKLQTSTHPRLAIYGVLEARFMPADILILGGLNEGRWPAQPDTGPWLNRPMRETFKMQMPEKDIGVAAHDVTQAFGYQKLILTWSQRLEGSPQIPSRWILRLKTVLQGANTDHATCHDTEILQYAKRLDQAEHLLPLAMPRPMPHINHRPKRFSVTEIEKLIRDPYAIYARKILKLEPLPDISREPDAALRGTLYHAAIADWNEQQKIQLAQNSLELLLRAGETAFANFAQDPEIALFWAARFKRIAIWLALCEPEFRNESFSLGVELQGTLEFKIGTENFVLSGRADRIDILNSNTAQIVDYKSGNPPTKPTVLSGLSPQLPLEAAILKQGGFKSFSAMSTTKMCYVHISGVNPAGKIILIKPDDETLDELAARHLAGLKTLLGRFQSLSHPYIPRLAIQKIDDPNDYDHLSRYQEWILAGS
jgi:ATP-dependent helicase/nuclease subunit B